MPTHEPSKHDSTGRPNVGFEETDVSVSAVVVFLAALAAFVGVFFIFCFGMGKVINTAIIKSDGPANRWNQPFVSPTTKREDLTSNPVMQQHELQAMTQRFPTPRLQIDDGNQEIADMHLREDLLLNYYSWVDQPGGKVRIPIAAAMKLIAQHGLTVAPAEQQDTLMAGDKVPTITVPLTNGFARTGYEQEFLETIAQQHERGEKPAEQASLGAK